MKITQNGVNRIKRRGFTLLELLVTVTIIAALSAISMPFAPALFKSNQVEQGVLAIAGTLEQARQHAVTHNTYVWVAFMPAPADKPQNGATMIVVESRGGIDTLNWSTDAVALKGHADLNVVGPVRSLPGMQIADAGSVSVPNLPASGSTSSSSLQPVQMLLPYAAGGNLTFSRAVQFTPDGRARVQSYTSQIELGLKPSFGASSSTSTAAVNVAVLRLGSLTGKIKVYRPS
ncbi:MAG: Tfp pilus assembly protein FimT/FimU [Candidatus Methylacidiphilales bacterium]